MALRFYTRPHKSDNTQCYIYMQYTVDRQYFRVPVTYPSGHVITIPCNEFVPKAGLAKAKKSRRYKAADRAYRVRVDYWDASSINSILDDMSSKISRIESTLKRQNRISSENVKLELELMMGGARVIGYIDEFVSANPQWTESYLSCVRGVKRRLNMLDENLTFRGFDVGFEEGYREFHDNQFSPSTLNTDISIMKAFLKWSFKKKIHQNDSYTAWGQVSVESSDVFLTPMEVNKLVYYTSHHLNLMKVRDIFLWIVFSGMRISEYQHYRKMVIDPKQEHLITTPTGKKLVRYRKFKQKKKTDTFNRVDFSPQMRLIWDKYHGFLPVYSDSHINELLKVIAKDLGIDKNLTTKVGRHTRATLAQQFGMSIADTSKSLGHSSVSMTKTHYMHGEDTTIQNESFEEQLALYSS